MADNSIYIAGLDPALPAGSEKLSEGDDSIRHLKGVVNNTFPQASSAVALTSDKMNSLDNNIHTDTSQVVLGPNVKANLNLNKVLVVTANEVNCSGKPLTNVSSTVSTGTDVGNRNYNDGRYYTQAQIFTIIETTKNDLYPVGSVYENYTNGTNPATLLGFGTWVEYGAGRVTVSRSSGETEFNAVGEVGGSKTHTLTTAQTPSHSHTIGNHNHTSGVAYDSGPYGTAAIPSTGRPTGAGASANSPKTSSNGAQTTSLTGSNNSHNNIQPYIVIYRWVRTV